jgi:hypothetical protein
VAVVKDSFLTGSPFNLTAAADSSANDPGWNSVHVNPDYIDYTATFSEMQRDAGTYLRLNTSACFDLYDDYWRPQGNVIVLVKNETAQMMPAADSLLKYVYVVPRWDDWGKNMWALENGTTRYVGQSSPARPVTKWYLGRQYYEVSSCLVQDPSKIISPCRFQYSPYILVTVCVMNLVKACVMLLAWVSRRIETRDAAHVDSQILYTLGDAIASFTRVPDRTTLNMSMATKDDFTRKRHPLLFWKVTEPKTMDEPREFCNQPKRWMQAASLARWIVLIAS